MKIWRGFERQSKESRYGKLRENWQNPVVNTQLTCFEAALFANKGTTILIDESTRTHRIQLSKTYESVLSLSLFLKFYLRNRLYPRSHWSVRLAWHWGWLLRDEYCTVSRPACCLIGNLFIMSPRQQNERSGCCRRSSNLHAPSRSVLVYAYE